MNQGQGVCGGDLRDQGQGVCVCVVVEGRPEV